MKKKVNPDNEKQSIDAVKKMIVKGNGSVKFSKSDEHIIHDAYPYYVREALLEYPEPITLYGNSKIVFVNKSDAIDWCIKKGKSLNVIGGMGTTVGGLSQPFFKVLSIAGVDMQFRIDENIGGYGFSYDEIRSCGNFPNKRMLTSAKNGKLSMNFIEMFIKHIEKGN